MSIIFPEIGFQDAKMLDVLASSDGRACVVYAAPSHQQVIVVPQTPPAPAPQQQQQQSNNSGKNQQLSQPQHQQQHQPSPTVTRIESIRLRPVTGMRTAVTSDNLHVAKLTAEERLSYVDVPFNPTMYNDSSILVAHVNADKDTLMVFRERSLKRDKETVAKISQTSFAMTGGGGGGAALRAAAQSIASQGDAARGGINNTRNAATIATQASSTNNTNNNNAALLSKWGSVNTATIFRRVSHEAFAASLGIAPGALQSVAAQASSSNNNANNTRASLASTSTTGTSSAASGSSFGSTFMPCATMSVEDTTTLVNLHFIRNSNWALRITKKCQSAQQRVKLASAGRIAKSTVTVIDAVKVPGLPQKQVSSGFTDWAKKFFSIGSSSSSSTTAQSNSGGGGNNKSQVTAAAVATAKATTAAAPSSPTTGATTTAHLSFDEAMRVPTIPTSNSPNRCCFWSDVPDSNESIAISLCNIGESGDVSSSSAAAAASSPANSSVNMNSNQTNANSAAALNDKKKFVSLVVEQVVIPPPSSTSNAYNLERLMVTTFRHSDLALEHYQPVRAFPLFDPKQPDESDASFAGLNVCTSLLGVALCMRLKPKVASTVTVNSGSTNGINKQQQQQEGSMSNLHGTMSSLSFTGACASGTFSHSDLLAHTTALMRQEQEEANRANHNKNPQDEDDDDNNDNDTVATGQSPAKNRFQDPMADAETATNVTNDDLPGGHRGKRNQQQPTSTQQPPPQNQQQQAVPISTVSNHNQSNGAAGGRARTSRGDVRILIFLSSRGRMIQVNGLQLDCRSSREAPATFVYFREARCIGVVSPAEGVIHLVDVAGPRAPEYILTSPLTNSLNDTVATRWTRPNTQFRFTEVRGRDGRATYVASAQSGYSVIRLSSNGLKRIAQPLLSNVISQRGTHGWTELQAAYGFFLAARIPVRLALSEEAARQEFLADVATTLRPIFRHAFLCLRDPVRMFIHLIDAECRVDACYVASKKQLSSPTVDGPRRILHLPRDPIDQMLSALCCSPSTSGGGSGAKDGARESSPFSAPLVGSTTTAVTATAAAAATFHHQQQPRALSGGGFTRYFSPVRELTFPAQNEIVLKQIVEFLNQVASAGGAKGHTASVGLSWTDMSLPRVDRPHEWISAFLRNIFVASGAGGLTSSASSPGLPHSSTSNLSMVFASLTNGVTTGGGGGGGGDSSPHFQTSSGPAGAGSPSSRQHSRSFSVSSAMQSSPQQQQGTQHQQVPPNAIPIPKRLQSGGHNTATDFGGGGSLSPNNSLGNSAGRSLQSLRGGGQQQQQAQQPQLQSSQPTEPALLLSPNQSRLFGPPPPPANSFSSSNLSPSVNSPQLPLPPGYLLAVDIPPAVTRFCITNNFCAAVEWLNVEEQARRAGLSTSVASTHLDRDVVLRGSAAVTALNIVNNCIAVSGGLLNYNNNNSGNSGSSFMGGGGSSSSANSGNPQAVAAATGNAAVIAAERAISLHRKAAEFHACFDAVSSCVQLKSEVATAALPDPALLRFQRYFDWSEDPMGLIGVVTRRESLFCRSNITKDLFAPPPTSTAPQQYDFANKKAGQWLKTNVVASRRTATTALPSGASGFRAASGGPAPGSAAASPSPMRFA